MKRLLLVVFAALIVSLTETAAIAHPTPGSVAIVDLTVDGARIEQSVPVEELERALHEPLAEPGDDAAAIARRHADALRDYAPTHVELRSGDRSWGATLRGLRGEDASDGQRVVFELDVRAPVDGPLVLHDDLVAHEVVSHYTTVYIRSDWSTGALDTSPRLAGTIHAGRFDVGLRDDGGFARGFGAVVALGARHIGEGTDHLLFLFALVLVAPLAAAHGRWVRARGRRETIGALARIVTAFTFGHSLTLAVGALGVVALPSRLVESTIAVSIVVTAVHALRPLLPRREALVAGVFGLVHGLAFASSLPAHEVGAAQAVWTLLGFNLGVELAQLGLVVLVVPWVLLLASTPHYRVFRIGTGALTLVLAAGWLIERAFAASNPTAPIVRALEQHPVVWLCALAATAITARLTTATTDAPKVANRG